MYHPKVTAPDYIAFLYATPHVVTATEAERVQITPHPASHDAITRVLQRLDPDPSVLWDEAQTCVNRTTGILIVDDTTLDKPYAQQIALVHRHWSGKHHRTVNGINLTTLVWSDGQTAIPCDYRVYDAPNDALTKHDHFRAMLTTAKDRGFDPQYVCADSWYSSLANLKHLRTLGWSWLMRLKANRQVNPDNTGNRPLSACDLSAHGTRVHLKGYGFITVFRIDPPHGDTEYWATDDESMDAHDRRRVAGQVWTIETYHRDIKQYCGIERCQARSARAQRNHITCALRAYLRLVWTSMQTRMSRYRIKLDIIRPAIQHCLRERHTFLRGFPQAG